MDHTCCVLPSALFGRVFSHVRGTQRAIAPPLHQVSTGADSPRVQGQVPNKRVPRRNRATHSARRSLPPDISA